MLPLYFDFDVVQRNCSCTEKSAPKYMQRSPETPRTQTQSVVVPLRMVLLTGCNPNDLSMKSINHRLRSAVTLKFTVMVMGVVSQSLFQGFKRFDQRRSTDEMHRGEVFQAHWLFVDM